MGKYDSLENWRLSAFYLYSARIYRRHGHAFRSFKVCVIFNLIGHRLLFPATTFWDFFYSRQGEADLWPTRIIVESHLYKEAIRLSG